MGSDPQYAKWPLLPLAQHVFTLTNSYAARPAQQASAKALQEAISEHKMAPLYKYLAHPIEGILNPAGEGSTAVPSKPISRKSSIAGMAATKNPTTVANFPWDEELYNRLKADNDKELEELQKEEDEAVEKAGDTEIMAARGKRAELFAKIGDKVRYSRPCWSGLKQRGVLTRVIGQSHSSVRGRVREDRCSG
jgi:26S proteasome regulatory subunit N7